MPNSRIVYVCILQRHKRASVSATSWGFHSHIRKRNIMFSFPRSSNEANHGVQFRHSPRNVLTIRHNSVGYSSVSMWMDCLNTRLSGSFYLPYALFGIQREAKKKLIIINKWYIICNIINKKIVSRRYYMERKIQLHS